MSEKTIDYRDIKITSPYEIISLEKLEITAEPNEHMKLFYTGVVSSDKRDEVVTNSKYNDNIKVCEYKDGKLIRTLFSGELYSIEVIARNDVYYLVVEALSYTYDMDIEKKRRSYQEASMTYDSMIKSVIKDYNSADFFPMVGKGDPIKIFTLEYDETDWEFLKRMASRFESVLISEGRHSSPKFWFGLPEGEDVTLEKTNYTIKKTLDPFKITKENYNHGISETAYTIFEIETTTYMYLGDNVIINDIKMKVAKSVFRMENGLLQFFYTLMPKKGIRHDIIKNEKIIGLSLEGTVINRTADKIKLKLDIDKSNPDCGDRLFKYESNYTYGDNWGWYVMPEMNHFASLFMPNSLEENAYSTRSIRRDGDTHPKTQDPRIKILGTQHYKEFKMDNEQLKITVKDDKTGKMHIRMKEKKGIEIMSDKDILFKSKKDINIKANKISLRAEEGIYFINQPGSVILDGDTHFYNTLIDIKAIGDAKLKLPDSKKAKIFRSIAGTKTIGNKTQIDNTGCSGGDPVDVATGNYYIDQVDMIIRGSSPIVFSRFYNALDEYDGVMGKNWHHNYDFRMEIEKTCIKVIWNDGRLEEFFQFKDNEFISETDPTQIIIKDINGDYSLKAYTGKTYIFDEKGFLKTVSMNGKDDIQLTYENNLLAKIENKCGFIKILYFNGMLSKIYDEIGRFVEYKYSNNSLVNVKNINGGHTIYEYDNDFQITKVIDPNGNVMVENLYDQKGRVIEQNMPTGGKVYFAYDDENKITKYTERNDIETIYQRDSKNRVIEIKMINGSEKMSFDHSSNLNSFEDKNGNKYTYEQSKTFKTTKPNGDIVELTYDDNGNIITQKNPDGSQHKYEYDKFNRVISYYDPLESKTCFKYDELGNLIEIDLPDGSKKTYLYDFKGNITAYIDAEKNETKFTYDKANRVITQTLPKENQTVFGYNQIDKITTINYPNSFNIKKTYDYCGLLKEEIDELGSTIRYSYYADGKIAKKTDAMNGVTDYIYDVMGNLICAKNPDGSEKIYRYNEANLLTVEIDEEGNSKHYFHDNNGNIIKMTDENKNSTKYEYDKLNRVVKEIDANYNETSYEYRYDDKMTKKTDALGGITENKYNELSQLISTKNAVGAETKYVYDLVGNMIKEINADGIETKYEYNRNGKITKKIYADETYEKMVYDANSNLINYMDCGGNSTLYEYDNMDRVSAIINALGGKKEITYTPKGKISTVKDENNFLTSYEYDLNDNLIKTTNAKGFSTSFKYDVMNRLTEVHQYNKFKQQNSEEIVEKELVTVYKYNNKGLLLQDINSKNQIVFFEYDPHGNLIKKEDRERYVTQFDYDSVNNLKKINYNDEKSVVYEHDALNRVIKMMDWIGTSEYEYDILGRILMAKNANGNVVHYSWGLLDERKSVKYNDGSMVEYEFDLKSRIKSVISGNDVTKYLYNSVGTIWKEILPNGQVSEYNYDSVNRMSKLTHFGKNSEILDCREFSYDNAGRKIKINECTNELIYDNKHNNYKQNGNYYFVYDELNQLTKITNQDNRTQIFAYDNLGNRIKKQIQGDREKLEVQYFYNELNQMIEIQGKGEQIIGFTLEDKAEIQYDARGNMTRIQSGGKNISEYIYDKTSRLIRTTTHEGLVANYAYDGNGIRVKKEINNDSFEYLVDLTSPYNNLLLVDNKGKKDKYIYGNKLIGTKKGDNFEKLFLHDEMGSLIRTTGFDGNCKSIMQYDAFGERTVFGKSELLGFTGYEVDDGTGLDFVQARYYMADFGRFVEEDRNKGNVFDFGSLNYYVHCLNNPLGFVDLDGFAAKEAQYGKLTDIITFTNKELKTENGNNNVPEIKYKYNEGTKKFITMPFIPGNLLSGTITPAGSNKDATIDITIDGKDGKKSLILKQVKDKNEYEKSSADNIFFVDNNKKAIIDINRINKAAGYEEMADYIFICEKSKAEITEARYQKNGYFIYEGKKYTPIFVTQYGNTPVYMIEDENGNIIYVVRGEFYPAKVFNELMNDDYTKLFVLEGEESANKLAQAVFHGIYLENQFFAMDISEMMYDLARAEASAGRVAAVLDSDDSNVETKKQVTKVIENGTGKYFDDLPTVKPRSINRIEPAPNQSVLTKSTLQDLKNNEAYIYVVDSDNNIQIAPRISPHKDGIKHTQLTGGEPVKAAGQLMLGDDGILRIDKQTGRYSAQHDNAINQVKLQLEEWNATIEIVEGID